MTLFHSAKIMSSAATVATASACPTAATGCRTAGMDLMRPGVILLKLIKRDTEKWIHQLGVMEKLL